MAYILFRILVLFCIFSQVKGNGCNECHCEPTLKLLTCFGYDILTWPFIPNTTWIYDVMFMNTLIHELPDFESEDYQNLKTLKIENCPLLACEDLVQFQVKKPTVEIISDIECTFDSTTNGIATTTFHYPSSSTVFFTTILPENTTKGKQYWKIIGICLGILLPILLGLIIVYILLNRQRPSSIAMIEMTEFA